MAWFTATRLNAAARSVLGMGASETVPTHWDEPISAALSFAQGAIRRALAGRGFTGAQIAAWDDLESFHRRIAICNLFREGGIGKGYDSIHLGEYCKALGELATVNVTVDGILVDPNLDKGQCASGEFDDSDARISQMEE